MLHVFMMIIGVGLIALNSNYVLRKYTLADDLTAAVDSAWNRMHRFPCAVLAYDWLDDVIAAEVVTIEQLEELSSSFVKENLVGVYTVKPTKEHLFMDIEDTISATS